MARSRWTIPALASFTLTSFTVFSPTAQAFFPPVITPPVGPPTVVEPPPVTPPVVVVPPVTPPVVVPPPPLPPVVVDPPCDCQDPCDAPEPSTLIVGATGLAAAMGWRLRRKK